MSYIHMDHAGWVQRNITAAKSRPPSAAEKRAITEHKGWHAAPDELTPFQRRAFDILGIVGGGIYNAPIAWKAVHWQPRQIIAPWSSYKAFGTWDFSEMTRFVFLCHDARIRGYIAHGGPRYFKVWLSERSHEGATHQRHPNLAEALAAWREDFPADHPIVYRNPEVTIPGHTSGSHQQ